MADSLIKENILKIKDSILEAEKKSCRNENSVKLCAVSKFHPKEDVLEALAAEQFIFGENRVQEAYEKFNSEDIKKLKPSLHIIGSLQTNKVKKAVEIAECIQSVDREELLREIEKRASNIDRQIDVLFELHTGEESKAGFLSEDEAFYSLENICKGLYPHVHVKGFMTMAPFTEDEKAVRASFIKLRNVLEKSNVRFPELNLTELSMGMSGDYKIAIEEGSTMVRIGTAIFGERK